MHINHIKRLCVLGKEAAIYRVKYKEKEGGAAKVTDSGDVVVGGFFFVATGVWCQQLQLTTTFNNN